MLRYIIKKVFFSVLFFALASVIICMIINAYLDLGGEKVLYLKYFEWMKNVLRFEFGYSKKYSEPVMVLIRNRMPKTLLLTGASLIVSMFIGLLIGFLSVSKGNSKVDGAVTLFLLAAMVIPLVFILWTVVKDFMYLQQSYMEFRAYEIKQKIIFLIENMTGLSRFVFSVFFLTVIQSLVYTRYIRLEILKAYGVPYEDTRSVKKYVLRAKSKKLLSVITALCLLQVPCLFFGDLITETLFAWQGVGRLGYEAVKDKDYFILIGVGMLGLMLIFVSNFFADILFFSFQKHKEGMEDI